MSWEAWGDDDDGLDGMRESYRKTLLGDGWLDDVQAEELINALRGVMGLVQLIAHGDGKDHTKNHRYVEAESVLSRLATVSPTGKVNKG